MLLALLPACNLPKTFGANIANRLFLLAVTDLGVDDPSPV